MSQVLTFNDVQLIPVLHNNQPWIRSAELARALNYSDERRVSVLYNRHSDEFTNDMSVVLNLGTTEQPIMTRIFSLRGCHLLAMFARTAVAKAFRVWVLDVLEHLNRRQAPALDTTSRLSTSKDQCRKNLESLKRAWVSMAPIGYGEAPKMIAAAFGVDGVDNMTVAQVEQACAWVQGKIDALMQGQLALPAPATPFSEAARWEAELTRLHEDVLRDTENVLGWLGNIERRLRDVTGPMFIALTEDIVRGTPMVSKERGRCALHGASRDAIRQMRENLRDMSTGLWYASWFATALKLRTSR